MAGHVAGVATSHNTMIIARLRQFFQDSETVTSDTEHGAASGQHGTVGCPPGPGRVLLTAPGAAEGSVVTNC